MDNKTAFYVSAIFSFLLYFSMVFIFLFFINNSQVRKIDAMSKATVLQLDILIDDKPDITSKKNEKKLLIKSKSINENKNNVVKKTSSVSAKRRSDLKSLFANVDTKVKNVVKHDVLNIKKSSIASRYKSKFEKERNVEDIKVSKLEKILENKSTKKNIVQESKYEKDPYFSNIYQLISSRWKPTVFFNELSAKVLITISSNGSFSYQFIQYSNNTGFDIQLKKFLDSQTMLSYPISPSKNSSQIEITFQSKGN